MNDGEQKNTTDSETPRIIAIGASAGGLEPFEKFFAKIPSDTGLAYVVVQHLSPDFKSMMDELLHRHSPLAIKRVEQGMSIEPDTIYLNPPRIEMEVKDGKFVCTSLPSRKTLHLPINTLFMSIAQEQKERSVGIILSGTGSDGTIGAEAIRAAGGTVLVQEPSTAKFDGMPGSAIDRMSVDAVATPEDLAKIVCRIAGGERISPPAVIKELDPKQRVFQLLRDRYATDFGYYKTATIERRLMRRSELLGLESLSDYVKKLENDDEELEALYSDFLIEVTSFFRDPEAFDALKEKVTPKLIEKLEKRMPIRVWVPGCASGQEAYSIAILLAEAARERNVDLQLKVLATDIHHRSLEAANVGVYEAASLNAVPADIVARYFERVGERFQIRPELRQMVVFSVHNILRDPPFTRIDLISCRNLLIYLNDPAQQKALAYFHFSLNTNAHLYLGPSETLGAISTEFDTVDPRWRIYRKRRDVRLIESMTQLPRQDHVRGPTSSLAPIASMGNVSMISGDARRVYDRAISAILKKYAPAGFMLRKSGEVVRVFGDAGRFITVSEGTFSQRIDDLVQHELRVVVSAALDRATTPSSLPFERRVRVASKDSTHVSLIVRLERVGEKAEEVDLLLLTIEEEKREIVMPPIADHDVQDIELVSLLRQNIQDLERELQGSEETLQTTIEELETSNEELQAANEELMASNEELQSTNEELHSVNEELFTVSAEHQRKIVELTEMSNDIEHLLRATDVGTIFVDADLRVRRFTPAASRVFNILAQDIGRPIDHITNKFPEISVADLVTNVISTREVVEREFEMDDRHILFRVLPYITSNRDVEGAVVTTVDVTEIKTAQLEQRRLADRYEAVVEDIGDIILRWRARDGKITFCNSSFLSVSGKGRSEVINAPIKSIMPADQHKDLKDATADLTVNETASLLLDFNPDPDRHLWCDAKIRAVGEEGSTADEYQLIARDVSIETAYRSAVEQLSVVDEAFENDFEGMVQRLLEIGASFFDAQLGIFAYVDKQKDLCNFVVTHNGESFGIYPGTSAKLQDWFNGQVVEHEGLFSVDVASEDPVCSKLYMHKKSGIESYIGDLVAIRTGETAVVSFASREPRTAPLTKLHQQFMSIFSDRIGRLVDLHSANQVLHQTRSELQFVLDNIPALIWYKDDQNRILRLNKGAADSMGTTIEEATGGNTYELFPEMAAKYHEDDLKVIESGVPMLNIVEEYTPRDGKRGWAKTDKTPYLDPQTGERRLLVVAFDVTAIKMNEATVRDLNDRLSRNNARLVDVNSGLQQFAHVASHDLQEPLRKLIQFTEYLEEDCTDSISDDGKYFLRVISDSAQRMRVLVRDILSLSSASGKELVLEQCDPNAIIKQIWSEYDVLVRETGASIEVSDLPKISADPTLLEQLLGNLISNGLKYKREDVPAKITVSATQTDMLGVVITITDNGIGIEGENPDRVFEPFKRLHDRNTFPGTGIGLAICRTVCDRHEWLIRVAKTGNTGTTFEVNIPQGSNVK